MLHSVPSYKKQSYMKQLVDSLRCKKGPYKDTEKIRNTFVKKLVWFGFIRGHYEVSTGSSIEAMSIPFTRSLL